MVRTPSLMDVGNNLTKNDGRIWQNSKINLPSTSRRNVLAQAAVANSCPVRISPDGKWSDGSASGPDVWAHDPSIIRIGGSFYVYTTGGTVGIRTSQDSKNWKLDGNALNAIPKWFVPLGITDVWAPDVSFHNGKYYMYFCGRRNTVSSLPQYLY